MCDPVSISRFCKPSKTIENVISRHIYIAGLGEQMKTTKSYVRELFEVYGPLDDINSPNNDAIEFIKDKRYCYVSYISESSAMEAVNAYNHSSSSSSSSSTSTEMNKALPKLLVKYAVLSTPKGSVLEPPCTSTTSHIIIPGLKVIENFISDELEQEILQSDMFRLDSDRWEELLSRRIQHYGLIFNYRTLMLDYSTPILPIPPLIQNQIIPNVSDELGRFYSDGEIPLELQQMTVNEYEGGQGIANHIDTDSCLGPDLAIISLGSGVVMTFQERRPKDKNLAALIDYYPTPPVVARTVLPMKSSDHHTSSPIPDTIDAIDDIDTEDADRNSDDESVEMKNNHRECVEEEDRQDKTLSDTIGSDHNNNDDNDNHDSTVPVLSIIGAGSTGQKKYIRKKYVYLPPKSLLLMQGEARYNWSHGITPRVFDKVNGILQPRQRRVSLTFRQVMLPGEVPSSRLKSSELEIDHVFKVYDSIAIHWNHTRGRRKVHWHRVKSFLEDLPKGSLIADIGSGDGKYFNVNPQTIVIGCDRSLKLLEVSHESSHDTYCCDAVKLPMISNQFDATLCIAVFHHLASLDRRIALLRELLRITRVGGEIMIQAWALEQDSSSRWDFAGTKSTNHSSSSSSSSFSTSTIQDNTKTSCSNATTNKQEEFGKIVTCGTAQQDVLVPWKLQQRFFFSKNELSGDSSDTQDEKVDCNHVIKQSDGSLLFQRYCHVFKKGELEDLCSSCPGNRVLESGWDRGNWFVRLIKTSDIHITLTSKIDHHSSNISLVTNSKASTDTMTMIDDANMLSILSKAGVGPTGVMPRFATRL